MSKPTVASLSAKIEELEHALHDMGSFNRALTEEYDSKLAMLEAKLEEALSRIEALEAKPQAQAPARKPQPAIGQAVGNPYQRGGVWYQKVQVGFNQTSERRIEPPTA